MAANVGKILLDKEILLESGTNELEVLVFNVAEFCFGINVAKVREVFPRGNITALAKAHPSVRGVFRLRDQVVPCVSLVDHLGINSQGEDSESTLILTDFNQQQTAFLVDRVERIHRLSWEKVMAMPPLEALQSTPVTAVVHCDGRLVVMLDFEMIIDQVTRQAYRVGAIANTQNLPREQLRIIMCDDSPTIRQAVSTTLRASGYTRLEIFENGAQAWKWIEQRLAETGSAEGVADLIISDIEMPQIDGLHLTKRIKENAQLRNLPVLLYSSIVTPDNVKKGEAVGANMQISKPELNKIVEIADELIASFRQGGASAPAVSPTTPTLSAAPAIAPVVENVKPAPATVASAAEVAAPVSARPPVAAKPTPVATTGSVATPPAAKAEKPRAKPPARVPKGVNPQLWQTFVTELSDHVANLSRQLNDAATGASFTDDETKEFFRTLHTIKSASMVIPCDPITHATHAIEDLLSPLRRTPAQWPQATLSNYVQWLDAVTSPLSDVNDALNSEQFRSLMTELS
jgi:two-component system chemotaxis response regulator CheV